ncbi:suppressor of fused domain protein [Cellulophaga sp. HaHa_2_95]|uniref:suppressor of fused domain protein n=1 Tax=unclassified Cellulophaga TaxID=2634405 RepID=UPI001C4EE305|nr:MULTISPECIES: suppressor of fused domain protein [unclassified Cellulophaga]QXP51384.1 suppressor of fused domain protein [Cellulophaga sp. HaHa_2_1]QXP56290.1 suppressor of fused domain protein [Cellulophaga sp. HaHa_2_95]
MEKSESGSPIYRYTNEDKNEFEGAGGDSSMEEISDHIEAHIGEIHMVFHEIVSEQVHIDVHWVKPTKEHPFHTLITSGMSDKPMNTPEGVEGCDYAELSICLPEEWKISEEDFKDEKNYWPIRFLKYLARFPHEYNTWLSYGHTIPNGNPPEAFAENTKLNTMILLPSIMFGDKFPILELENKKITFYTLIPLYDEEVALKMAKGVDALFDGFDKFGLTDVLQINRPNTIVKKKFLGLF